MLITFCVASLMGFIQAFTRFEPTPIDIQYGVPLVIAIASIAVVALFSRLKLRKSGGQVALAAVIVFVIAIGTPGIMGLRPNMTFNYVMFVTGIPVYAGLLIGAMVLLRDRGYRLVRVIPQR